MFLLLAKINPREIFNINLKLHENKINLSYFQLVRDNLYARKFIHVRSQINIRVTRRVTLWLN